MEEECTDLVQESNQAGDKHYRTMTTWLTGGRTRTLLNRAYRFALAYRRALQWVIDCYGRIRNSVRAKRKLEEAVEFKSLVEKDIVILEQRGAMLTDEPSSE
ncbi:MAG: hypothetical protein ACKVQJ_10800 [Pyrinomonadaceae bacterium]